MRTVTNIAYGDVTRTNPRNATNPIPMVSAVSTGCNTRSNAPEGPGVAGGETSDPGAARDGDAGATRDGDEPAPHLDPPKLPPVCCATAAELARHAMKAIATARQARSRRTQTERRKWITASRYRDTDPSTGGTVYTDAESHFSRSLRMTLGALRNAATSADPVSRAAPC